MPTTTWSPRERSSISDADGGDLPFQTDVTGAAGNLGASACRRRLVQLPRLERRDAASAPVTRMWTRSTITSADGTSREVIFAIHGANDAPTVTGAATGSSRRPPSALQSRGDLFASDPDGGPASSSMSAARLRLTTQDFRFQVDNLKIIKERLHVF